MKLYAIPLALAITVASVGAEEVTNLKDAINQAVLLNPTVNASWHEFEAAREGQRVGEGGYYPKVDLTVQGGRERQDIENTPGGWDYYNPVTASLVLKQMIFDGFATSKEVERLSQTRQVRYYEFLGVSQDAALEAVKAYLDTRRYQQLVELAKDTYVEHHTVHEDINRRTNAGVGREVDLEQARARLALAESNLLTEVTNLYDVSARFERIIGDIPAESLETPTFDVSMIPAERIDALATAYVHNPALNAATRNIAAANAELAVRKAAMMPTLDLRIAKTLEDEVDNDLRGQIDQEGIHLVLNYNLYNGGSDSARNRQYYEKSNTARELRDKVCRDVKQDVLIAHNDISSLEEQVAYLNRNQESVGKAREAYRNQFNIGQRTLLDLLDTENEYFEVRRAHVNAQHDLELARMRTLTAMGQLLTSQSQVHKGIDSGVSTPTEIAPCPFGGPSQAIIDKDALLGGILDDDRFRQTDSGLAFSMRAQFAHNSSELTSDDEKDISDGAQFLADHPDINAVIEGHTDSTGTEKYNQWLSERRAQAVYDRLIELGVAAERLTFVGRGESQPLTGNESSEGRALNRRVDMVMDADMTP